jgi:hypothetical protein
MEGILADRGAAVTCATIGQWVRGLGPVFAVCNAGENEQATVRFPPFQLYEFTVMRTGLGSIRPRLRSWSAGCAATCTSGSGGGGEETD